MLDFIFKRYEIDSVIHFAGLKAVAESVEIPLRYYHNNVAGSISLFECMRRNGVKNIVFSSSATVYGMTGKMPLCEDDPLGALNPYGRSKLIIEYMLRDIHVSDNTERNTAQVFQSSGCPSSGKIGEDPMASPTT